MKIDIFVLCGERSRVLHRVCRLKSCWLKCRSMIWNPSVPLRLPRCERLHELSMPPTSFSFVHAPLSNSVRWDVLLCSCAKSFCGRVVPILSQCQTSQCFARCHCAYFGLVVAGPPCSSAKTPTMQVSSEAFLRIQPKRMVEQFFPFCPARPMDTTSWTRLAASHKTFLHRTASHL